MVPTDLYPTIFSFLSPRDLDHVIHCSKELQFFGEKYKSFHQECILCHDEWATFTSEFFPDLDILLHQDEIKERIDFMTRHGYHLQTAFLCKSCQNIVWTNETVYDLYYRISKLIQIIIVPMEMPWAYLYHIETKQWSPLCMDLTLYSLDSNIEE
jgi:hypothetical protein